MIESLLAVRGVGSNHCRRKAATLALMSVCKGGGDQIRQHFLATARSLVSGDQPVISAGVWMPEGRLPSGIHAP